MYSWYPSDVLNTPRCTHDIPPMYSWYPPDVLMVSPDVLNTPRCTHDIPPMYSWYPPDVLMVSPDVLNTPNVLNIPRCTEHTLYRVVPWSANFRDKLPFVNSTKTLIFDLTKMLLPKRLVLT